MNRTISTKQRTLPRRTSIRLAVRRSPFRVVVLLALSTVGHARAGTPVSAPSRHNQESLDPLTIDLMIAMALAERNAPELLVPAAEMKSLPLFRDAADRLVHRPPRVALSAGPRRLAGGAQLGWDVTAGVFQDSPPVATANSSVRLPLPLSAVQTQVSPPRSARQECTRALPGLTRALPARR